jgi:hypothetical protein
MIHMKKFLLGGLLSASTLLLASCLGGGGSNEISRSGVPGVVRFDMKTMKTVIDSYEFHPFSFYDPNIETLELFEGDCILFGYTVNLDNEANSNYQTTGIISGTMTAITPLDKYPLRPELTDTATLLEQERPISYAVANTGSYLYLSKKLFLQSTFKQKNEQKTNWICCYDPELPTKTIDGKKVYSLFLRATIQEEGKLNEAETSVINAFEAATFFDQIMSVEKGEGKTEVYFIINHIKEIKEDNSFTWAASEVLPLEIPAN